MGGDIALGRTVRLAAAGWHRLIARSEIATRLYVPAVAGIARQLPDRVRRLVEWAVTGQNIAWKPIAFAPRRVIVGKSTVIRLAPHLGEFDQAALFSGVLAYEAPVMTWLEQHAASRYDAVIDIGANVGIYAVALDAFIRRSPAPRLKKIYAFEPSRAALARLLANLAANDTRAVEALAVAISDQSGLDTFHEPEGHLTNGTLAPDFAAIFSDTVRKSTVVTLAADRLEPLFQRHDRVLVKVDAEGWEPKILKAMETLLARYRSDLLIEVLPGIDEQLRGLVCLRDYKLLHILGSGVAARNRLEADPDNRDWLLTQEPGDMSRTP